MNSRGLSKIYSDSALSEKIYYFPVFPANCRTEIFSNLRIYNHRMYRVVAYIVQIIWSG